MYKTSRVKKILYMLKFGLRPSDIVIEYRTDNGKKKFVFVFEPKTLQEEKLIELARETEEELSSEDFNKFYDEYWKLIKEKYPKKR